MKFHKPTVIANVVLLILFGLLACLAGSPLTGLGTANLVICFIDFLLVIVFVIAKNTPALKTALLLCGLTLLIGISLCSAFPVNLNMH